MVFFSLCRFEMSGGFKRKRTYGPPAGGALELAFRPRRPPLKRTKRIPFVPGRDRVGGFYGRYSGRNAELKFHDVDLDDAAVAPFSVIVSTINVIPQGVTEVQRIGRKCTLKNIMWRYRLTLDAEDAVIVAGQAVTFRLILYQDKQCNGATALVTDILETDDFRSFRNLANAGRFNILMDRTHTVNKLAMGSDGAGLMSTAQVTMLRTLYKSCNIPIEFNGVTGALGEIRSNNLGVLLLVSNAGSGIDSKIRLRFSDM